MRAIGSVIVALLIRDQRQGRRQIQHGLRQGDPQEQAHLSDAERKGRMHVQTSYFISCEQGMRGGRAQDPPSLVGPIPTSMTRGAK
jgi:hypothetical protein